LLCRGHGTSYLVCIATYSNDRGESRKLAGGWARVDFSIFARTQSSEAKIVITDFSNDVQADYVRAIEAAFDQAVDGLLPSMPTEWTINVVRTLPP